MRTAPPTALERARQNSIPSNPGDMHGRFIIRGPGRYKLHIISSGKPDPEGTQPQETPETLPSFVPAEVFQEVRRWEHVSVSVLGKRFCPSWEEMVFVKNLFWSEEEAVIQFHPPESEYVNTHPYTLHLWKPPYPVPTPPGISVGLPKKRPYLSRPT